MMKTKLFAASLAVIAFAAFGSTQARADATAVADLNITSATLSGDVSALGSPSFTNQNSAEAGLGVIGSPETLATSGGSLVTVGTIPTNFSSGFSTLNGSLLIPGGASSETSSSSTVVNDYYSNSGQSHSGTSASFQFTATSNGTIVLTLSGTNTSYASIYNTTNFAQSSATANSSFVVTLTNVTAGGTQKYQPDALNVSSSSLGIAPTVGSLTPVGFSGISDTFNLIAGDVYSFSISQTVSAQTYAVPEPGTLALFGTGLLGLGFLMSARRRNSNAA